jgi:hypothetical protein
MRILVPAVSAVLAFTVAASAQDQTPTGGAAPSSAQDQLQGQSAQHNLGNGPIGHWVKQQLEAAGFSDVIVVPSAFVVRAKNTDGNPVMMLIDSDSMTAVELQQGGDQDTTTGQGSSSDEDNRSPGSPSQTLDNGAGAPE